MESLGIPFEPEDLFSCKPGSTANFPHAGIQRLLASMPEWGMDQVVRQRRSLSQFRGKTTMKCRIFKQQILGNGSGDLRNFHAVSQPCAVKIRLSDSENLRLPLKPPKGRTMQDGARRTR